MNERIQELIKQADEKFSCEYNGDYTVFNKEKFAELIVRECAEMMPQDNLYKMVLKHFGVEQ